MKLKHLDLFSGIGGFALGFRNAGGIKTVAFCEIEPYAQKVLAKNFPGTPVYPDIKEVKGDELVCRLGAIDIITAGFPCQDISCANPSGKGLDGERSGLFYEAARIIGEVRPRFALLENVANLLSRDRGASMCQVLAELAAIGYDCEWHCISAADFGAPHIRDRVWILAYPNDARERTPKCRADADGAAAGKERVESFAQSCGYGADVADTEKLIGDGGEHGDNPEQGQISPPARGESSILPDTASVGCERPGAYWASLRTEASGYRQTAQSFASSISREWEPEPDVGRVANGVPDRVDRLRGLGNAIVPRMAEFWAGVIKER